MKEEPLQDNVESRDLGEIGETEVRIVAEGPKATWCVDVLCGRFESVFEEIKRQAEKHAD